MFDIEMQQMSDEFLKCWQAAGIYLNDQLPGEIHTWLRAHPYPPFLEHLSFRLGNQLFFIRIEDVDGKVDGPGIIRGLHMIADGCQGHACLMPMKKKFLGGSWVPTAPGWGLVDARTKRPVDPVSLVTIDKIEMTPWEIHDLAVQVVRTQLEQRGYQLMTWQGNPHVDPAIWFIGDSKGPEWFVVRAARYPENQATRPANWQAIADQNARLSRIGHFASVAIASGEKPFQSASVPAIPLWRGHAMEVRFDGLEGVKNEPV
jgi:hypothetical protein